MKKNTSQITRFTRKKVVAPKRCRKIRQFFTSFGCYSWIYFKGHPWKIDSPNGFPIGNMRERTPSLRTKPGLKHWSVVVACHVFKVSPYISHDGSVCMVYMLSWLGYIDGKWQTINMAYIRIRHGYVSRVMGIPVLIHILRGFSRTKTIHVGVPPWLWTPPYGASQPEKAPCPDC